VPFYEYKVCSWFSQDEVRVFPRTFPEKQKGKINFLQELRDRYVYRTFA
jgi:hypothetical protein